MSDFVPTKEWARTGPLSEVAGWVAKELLGCHIAYRLGSVDFTLRALGVLEQRGWRLLDTWDPGTDDTEVLLCDDRDGRAEVCARVSGKPSTAFPEALLRAIALAVLAERRAA